MTLQPRIQWTPEAKFDYGRMAAQLRNVVALKTAKEHYPLANKATIRLSSPIFQGSQSKLGKQRENQGIQKIEGLCELATTIKQQYITYEDLEKIVQM